MKQYLLGLTLYFLLVATSALAARADDYLNELEGRRAALPARPVETQAVFEIRKASILGKARDVAAKSLSPKVRDLENELNEALERLRACECTLADNPGGLEWGLGRTLNRMGLTLRRGFSEPADKEGAAMLYTRDIQADDDAATLEGCLKWRPQARSVGDTRWRFSPLAAVLGNLTTDSPGETNSWSVIGGLYAGYNRAGLAGWEEGVTARTFRIDTNVMARYDRSQDGTIEKLFGSVEATPIYGRWALGVRTPFGPCHSYSARRCGECVREVGRLLSWQWDFAARVDGGSVLEAGSGVEQNETLLAGQAAIRGHLYLDWLGHALGWGPSSTLFPLLGVEYIARYMPDQPTDFVDTFSAWFKLPFTSMIAVELSYIVGAEGASLDDVERVELALTFGF